MKENDMGWLIQCMLLLVVTAWLPASAQDLPPAGEQQLEDLAAVLETETDDDDYLQRLEQFRKHPVDINNADADELNELGILSGSQILHFMRYRQLLGPLVSIYEMQAIPSWDMVTIRKLLPFVQVNLQADPGQGRGNRFRAGDQVLLLRISQALEKSSDYDTAAGIHRFLGSPQRVWLRYTYKFRNLLQYGITADKDAGEGLFSKIQRAGFDFYSFHFFMRGGKSVRALALGDFTVNMGQGLMQWQGMAFRKGSDAIAIKRYSPTLRPYNSAGEFFFHRGAAVTLGRGPFDLTVFVSARNLSANIAFDQDADQEIFSSFVSSGYHRSMPEGEKRNNIRQLAGGASMSIRRERFKLSLNSVAYRFSLPYRKRDDPYNLYAWKGRNWFNAGLDYAFTWKNMHCFGEIAIDRKLNMAIVQGLMVSLDPAVDLSILYRHISERYQAIYGNAFTESTAPSNERGIYTGLCIRPGPGWKLNAYADFYQFPWLKFRTDAPSSGRDFLLVLEYRPNRQTEIYTRWRREKRQGNSIQPVYPMHPLQSILRESWRAHLGYQFTRAITYRTRAEILIYERGEEGPERGFTLFSDLLVKPLLRPYSGSIRLQYFETDSYDARVYAYENDVLYQQSIPAFSGKGFRYYTIIQYRISKQFHCWLRLAQTRFLDKTHDRRNTEIKIQFRYILKGT